ncbi:MAG TPA: cysteine desulfurase family protein [Candidatus Paceibacterota bacterium]|nr:cysteine desulfurase family protein [Candidatus Paceibacterota bacterium]
MQFWNTKKRVYADAAAATPLSTRSKSELVRLLPVYGNSGALHTEALEAKKELDTARKTIADAIGAHADEIIFTASGTEANNLAIQGVLRPLLQTYSELNAITSAIEHQSVLQPLAMLEREGLYTSELPVDEYGFISPEQLAEVINDETVFVSIQLVNSEIGTIQPIKEIAKVIRAERKRRGLSGYGNFSAEKLPEVASPVARQTPSKTSPLPLYLHVDASQAPLWISLKVDSLGCDLLTLDAQKIQGPKGVGALYVRRGTTIEPVIWGGVQEHSLRAGTPNVPLAGAFAVALEDAQKEVESRVQKIAEVRDFCFKKIKEFLPDVMVNGPELERGPSLLSESKDGPRSLRVANNLNISIPHLEAQMAVIALDAEGVAASTRSACSPGSEEPSHVIKAILENDLGPTAALRAGTAIRITFLPNATKNDALYIAEALKKVAKRYKNMA